MILSIWHLPQQHILWQTLSMACRIQSSLASLKVLKDRHVVALLILWLSYAEMTQTELVAMLRSRARKSGTQTSHYRGVSLLKQTGKWHAQINVGGKQVP